MNESSTRRQFLARAGALACGSLFLAGAAPGSRGRGDGRSPLLVVVYLRGGADFLNMIVPHEDTIYRALRPTIAVGEADGVLPLGRSEFALHPAMAPLVPLWDAGAFAPIVCTGSPHETRSHFDAQDFMERAAPGMRNVTTGWLNRFLQATAERSSSTFRALAVQGLLPRSLRGDFPALAVPSGMDRTQGEATLGEFEDLYGGVDVMGGGRDGADVTATGHATIETLRRFHEILAEAVPAEDAGYPRSVFGERMRTIAALAKAECGLEVAAVDYPGWDHHTGQGGAEGRQAQMLADYSSAVAALAKDLGSRLGSTLLVTMTEFGRNVAENGNSGTDHGRGSGMLLAGGGVKGGRVHGTWRGLAERELVDGRDLPVTTDFRDVMGTCLERFMDFDPPKGFFPGHEYRRLKLFG